MRIEIISNVEIPIPQSYRDCIKLALSDYYRYCGKEAGLLKMLCYAVGHPLFAFSFTLRLCSYRSATPLLGGDLLHSKVD